MEYEIVNPKPFFLIKFGCSNRAFYKIKKDLYEIANKIGIEIQDGYITEKCDYEGDLEKIIIYTAKRDKPLREAVLKFYGISKDDVPDNINIHLSIF